MEYDSLYKTLPQGFVTAGSILSGPSPANTTQATALKNAMNTSMKEFVCPSNSNVLYGLPTANPPTMALTNYKALSATSKESLLMAVNTSGTLPAGLYGTASIHPDGAIFPTSTSTGARAADVRDGQSHTIFIMETMDDYSDGATHFGSRWMVGAECMMTGMPVKSGPQVMTTFTYYHPSSYDTNDWACR